MIRAAAATTTALLTLTTAGAHAGVLTQSETYSFQLAPGGTTVTFEQFDELDGDRPLVGVEVSFRGTAQVDVTAENDAGVPAPDVAAALLSTLSLDVADLALDLALERTIATGGLAASDGVPGSGPDFFDFGTISDSGEATAFVSAPGDIDTFAGTGTITADITGAGDWLVVGISEGTVIGQNFMASGDLAITYTFVPAPAGATLLAVAALPLRRRRRA